MFLSGIFGRSKSEKHLENVGTGTRPKPRNNSPVRSPSATATESKREIAELNSLKRSLNKYDVETRLELTAGLIEETLTNLFEFIQVRTASKSRSILSVVNLGQKNNTDASVGTLFDTASGPQNASNIHETKCGNNSVAQAASAGYNAPPYVGTVTCGAPVHHPSATNTSLYKTVTYPAAQPPSRTPFYSPPGLSSAPQATTSTPWIDFTQREQGIKKAQATTSTPWIDFIQRE